MFDVLMRIVSLAENELLRRTGRLCWTLTMALPFLGFAQQGAQEPVSVTLRQALQRARQYGGQIQTANIAAQLAHEDKTQARAASLPSVNGFNQFIYTEGNGTPSGVYVANDGVHVYNEQLQAHEEVLSLVRRGEIRMAAASEAVARAKADVAARGVNATVIQDFYAIIAAAKKTENAQTGLNEAQQFLDLSRKLEQHGEAARADTIKAQLQVQQRQRDLQDAQLAQQRAKIALSVLIFPALRMDYSVLDETPDSALPPPAEQAAKEGDTSSPDVIAARKSVEEARLGVTTARYAYLPSFALDVFYGIDANQFAAQTNYPTPESGRSTLPNFLVPYRQNLGYSAQATLNVPLWNWGSIRSKVKQAKLREEQAQVDLTTAQKQLQADMATAYAEEQASFAQLGSLRSSSDLAAESLRLTMLRYKDGEATALEVTDAQTTANQGRAAYDDGVVRYRIALANIQNLTGALQQ